MSAAEIAMSPMREKIVVNISSFALLVNYKRRFFFILLHELNLIEMN